MRSKITRFYLAFRALIDRHINPHQSKSGGIKQIRSADRKLC
jgi:hypothetical protein